MEYNNRYCKSLCCVARWQWLVVVASVMGIQSLALAQQGEFKDLLGGALTPATAEKATFSAMLLPGNAQPGDEVTLKVSAQLPPKNYIYATTGSFEGRTQIRVTAVEGLEAIDDDFRPTRDPEVGIDSVMKQEVQKFHGDVEWTRKYRMKPDANVSKVSVDVELEGQYCSEGEGGQCHRIVPPAQMHAVLVPYEFSVAPKKADQVPAQLHFQLGPTKESDGKRVKVLITMKLAPEWHTFSTTFEGEGGFPTDIELETVYGLKPLSKTFEPSRPPEIKNVPGVNPTQQIYHDSITWSQEFEVLPEQPPFAYGVSGRVKYQTCKSTCIQNTQKFTLGVTSDDIPAPSSVPFLPEVPTAAVNSNQPQEKGLLVFLLSAIAAGLAALLTPCVFPMVPITVSFFLKQNEAKGGRPLALAFIFSAAIIASFVIIGVGIAGLFGATKANEFANNSFFNLFLATIFFAFALNMLGLFEIQVPSWLLSMTSSGEQTGGIVGVVFMALTFVLTSFSCTFAFVGGLLLLAARGQYYWPILGMLAFGATFAAPFFVLALTPSLLKKLPKSGGWLNSVKVVMGFIEAGVSVKYISIVDQQWNSTPWIFDYTNVMALWAVLAFCTGLYLLGQFRLSHDTPVQGLSPIRVLFAVSFLLLGTLFTVGLMSPERDTWLLDQLIAFAPAKLDNEEFELDFDRGIKVAQLKNKPLFIDFTGLYCTNCRLMEKRMAKPFNHRRLERCVLIQLYTDKVPKVPDEEAKRLLEQNIKLQTDWFGDVSLPAYAVVTPDGKTVLSKFIGLEARSGDFARFLDEGWNKWESMQGQAVSKVDAETPW